MWEKLYQYWQRGFGSKIAIAFSIAILIFLVVSFVGGYTDSHYFSWVGVGNYYPPSGLTTDAERSKTLWDWMELLIIPTVLVIGGYWLNKIERDREIDRREVERRREEKRRECREAEAADRIKENEWQIYLDNMTGLLEKGLRDSDLNSPLRDIAKVRTLTTLRRLDGPRKGMLLRFLIDARLITMTPAPVLTFLGAGGAGARADFMEADLHGAVLSLMVYQETDKPKGDYQPGLSPEMKRRLGIDLSEIYRLEADLSELPPGMSMRGPVLIYVDLSKADLSKAVLFGANLSDSLLINADLRGAFLSGANLSGAKLNLAKLDGAFLYQANLSGADLSRAKYDDATRWPEGFNPEEAGAIKVEKELS